MFDRKLIDRFRVKPGKRFRLSDVDPAWTPGGEYKQLAGSDLREAARRVLESNLEELTKAQGKLYAHDRWSLLVVLQAMDAAGKDGMVKHVMTGLNPQGCEVHSFKAPSSEELDHSFLWRCMKAAPARGKIVIFNRSHYEEVLVVRVHPEILAHQQLPPELVTKKIWKERYEDINCFERHLARNGTKILKLYLHISKEEQKRRFLDRLDNPEKNWKFSRADLQERGHWDAYQKAYEETLRATSTDWAPWYVIPSDHKYVARAIAAEIVTHAIKSLPIGYPKVGKEEKLALAEARAALESE